MTSVLGVGVAFSPSPPPVLVVGFMAANVPEPKSNEGVLVFPKPDRNRGVERPDGAGSGQRLRRVGGGDRGVRLRRRR